MAVSLQPKAAHQREAQIKRSQDRRHVTREGDRVHFRASDVFLPQQEDLFKAPLAEEELEGTIVGFSDSGSKARAFAVIDIVRTQNVIVPTSKLQIERSEEPEKG